MKIVNNKLKSNPNLRVQKDFPKEGIEFIDITPLTFQKEVLKEITDIFVNEIKDKNIDYLVLPEARGFLFGTPVADRLDLGVILVRKKGKLPPDYIETTFEFEKEYGKDIFELPKFVDGEYKGKNLYIIDDLCATGNTIKSLKKALIDLGANVIGYGCVLNISNLNDDKELFSIVDINTKVW